MQAEVESLLTALNHLSTGLMMPSESDFPFETFAWDIMDIDLSPEIVLHQLNLEESTPIETQNFNQFFEYVTEYQDWHSPEEKQIVRKFRELVEGLEQNLTDLEVYRIGESQIDAYVVGKTKLGNWAGIKTKLIET
jgi:Nuclease A inhibitor-like protein